MTQEEMAILWIIGYITIAAMVAAMFSVIYEDKEDGNGTAAFCGVFWLPLGVVALVFALLVAIPYKLTKLGVDRFKKV